MGTRAHYLWFIHHRFSTDCVPGSQHSLTFLFQDYGSEGNVWILELILCFPYTVFRHPRWTKLSVWFILIITACTKSRISLFYTTSHNCFNGRMDVYFGELERWFFLFYHLLFVTGTFRAHKQERMGCLYHVYVMWLYIVLGINYPAYKQPTMPY